ncbi:uncharacterized protein LOC127730440 [Mytilus californianus]|uniref:uncharacterized protein LOC127730440 n=1 Tax=Mytilus californianus TaxID=6549 RepID=UPI0022473B8E|nr:uncharacterized protein LOC127730440 [Mytilus californianus]
MGFPQRPKELSLYPLEKRLLSLRIPFMQIRQLPRGGQLSVKGNVVNVPVEVQPTINSLPHTLEKSGTISVKLKKKLVYKKCDFSENVRPFAVICALHYLMRTSDLYKSSRIEINEDWITEIAKTNEEETQNEKNCTDQEDNQDENDSDDESDHFSEVDENETHVGNTDTLLDYIPDDNPPCDIKSSDHETEQQENESESENEEANADVIEENNNKIDITLKNEKKAKQYEGKVIDLEKAIEEAENEYNENDQIAPATQQVEMEDAEIGPTESEQYVHFNPDRPTEHRLYDMSHEVGIEARTVELTNHANRISESDYFALIRSLNKKQWEFFQHVVTWVKTKHEPFYTFLTGGAGCGKSVVVRAIFQALHRHLCSIEGEDPDDIRILLCAPTGKAAYNTNGLTIHNAFQIQPNKGLDQSLSCDVLNTFRTKYRNLSLILIDEISMVGNKMFSLLERRLKKIKGSNCSFGGVSIIAIGDFFQLQPVFDSWIFNDLSKGLTALAPNYWKLFFSFHELTEIMRQKDDLEFAQLLNRLRQNQLTENDFAVLSTRTVLISDPTYRTNATHLFVENALVDNFNLQYISRLCSQKVKVKAVDTVCGDLPASVKTKLLSSLPEKQSDTANLAKEVVLAIGMKYDLTANIEVTDGLTNGSTCELKLIECKTTSLRPSIIWVKFEDARIDIGS